MRVKRRVWRACREPVVSIRDPSISDPSRLGAKLHKWKWGLKLQNCFLSQLLIPVSTPGSFFLSHRHLPSSYFLSSQLLFRSHLVLLLPLPLSWIPKASLFIWNDVVTPKRNKVIKSPSHPFFILGLGIRGGKKWTGNGLRLEPIAGGTALINIELRINFQRHSFSWNCQKLNLNETTLGKHESGLEWTSTIFHLRPSFWEYRGVPSGQLRGKYLSAHYWSRILGQACM